MHLKALVKKIVDEHFTRYEDMKNRRYSSTLSKFCNIDSWTSLMSSRGLWSFNTSRNYPERYIDYNDYKNKITDYIHFRDWLHDYITKLLAFVIWLQNYVTICYKLQM